MVFQRKRAFIVLLILLISLAKSTCYGQDNKKVPADFERLNSLLKGKKINEKDYLDSVEKITNSYLVQGIFVESKAFRNHLSVFYTESFIKNPDTLNQNRYYNILVNNATKNNRYGEAFYYYDKIIKLNGNNIDKNLKIITKKIDYHLNNEFFDKAAQEYKNNEIYINDKVNNLLHSTEIKDNDYLIFYLLNYTAYAYANLNDTTNFNTIATQVSQLRARFFQKKDLGDANLARIIFMSGTVPIYKAETLEKDYYKALDLADSMASELKEKFPVDNDWTLMIKDNLTNLRASAFLNMKQADSAEKYLDKLYKKSYLQGSQISLDEYILLAKLYEAKKNFAKANEYNKIVIETIEKKNRDLQNEMDELIYAFTEAEESKTELFRAEKVSQERAMGILVISFVAILVVLWFFMHIRKKDADVKKRIALLNYQATLQITELEESKNEMQENLGRDLHDNLASLLAGIKNKIEHLNIDIEDNKVKSNLEDINLKVEEAYLRVRNKSHDLYQEGFQNSEQNFEKRVKQLIDFSLPDEHFEKNIVLDKEAINMLNTDEKIELLKIIQEIMTNIIKHAKASKISIVTYEEEDHFNLSINDNGKGYDTQKKSGLGINSIKTRVQKMGGKTSILSNNSGTEINIILPGNNV